MESETNLLTFHHIGIVVPDVKKAVSYYTELMNKNVFFREEIVISNRVKVCFLQLEEGIKIEFIEPLDTLSPVAEFLRKGGGLHHICYETSDFLSSLGRLKKYGKILGKSVVGFENREVIFIFLRKKTMGVRLIEIASRI